MPTAREIDYEATIAHLFEDFGPVKRVWPVGARLGLWIGLEVVILGLSALVLGQFNTAALIRFPAYSFAITGFMLGSVAFAWLALDSSIPGREPGVAELTLLSIGIFVAALTLRFGPPAAASPLGLWPSMVELAGFAALPWLSLFRAAQLGVPLHSRLTGALTGCAALSFAFGAQLFTLPPGGSPSSIGAGIVAAASIVALSTLAGAIWLDPQRLWRRADSLDARPSRWAWLKAGAAFPIAAALCAGMLIFVLKAGPGRSPAVPDFDLAIENYQASLTNFRPNVPSGSMQLLLTAYIEHGMPSYMWDFGPEGFKLVGGRFEHLADGTPVTYTWFRGNQAGVMCMFRQTSGFKAPAGIYRDSHHMLFYRYHGYSVCLINVGGYGDFVSVIVSPIPMKQFMRLVTAATL
ncbi:MAG TPA: hypothetical protein VJN94_10960 [Candidatus Binataceae bacterium]|nr:hypothetical protein [Candidatus Binataceae bacterium]